MRNSLWFQRLVLLAECATFCAFMVVLMVVLFVFLQPIQIDQ